MAKSDLIMAFPIAMKTMFKGQKGQKLNFVRLRTTDFLVALNLTKFLCWKFSQRAVLQVLNI